MPRSLNLNTNLSVQKLIIIADICIIISLNPPRVIKLRRTHLSPYMQSARLISAFSREVIFFLREHSFHK